MNKNQDIEKMNIVRDKAYKSRNLASESINNYKYYMEASELFSQAIEIMDELLNKEEYFVNLIGVSHEVKMNHYLFLASKEHTQYERNNCLAMYYYITKDFEKAEIYCSKAGVHIENAIFQLNRVKFNEKQYEKNEAIAYDSKNWTYLKEMNEIQYYIFNVNKEAQNRNYSKVVDKYRTIISKCENLMKVTNDYMDVLDSEYLRISEGNYFAMISSSSIEMLELLSDKYSSKNGCVSESIFIDILSEVWKAFSYSNKAFKSNPLWDGYNDVREEQLSLLEEILLTHKRYWKLIYINFEDNKEFLKVMKNVDSRTYKKIENEISIKDNKSVKLWVMGSFWALLFILILGGISTVANPMSLWKFIAFITSVEVLMLIVGGFILKTIDSLSEQAFLKLMSIAFRSQINILKIFNKNSKSNDEIESDETSEEN